MGCAIKYGIKNMSTIICRAIAEKRLIEFNYDGGNRVVEPHCAGTTTAGNPGLRGYQVGGYSSSGKMGWKMFDMSKAGSVNISNSHFGGPRPDYNRNDKGMSSIKCQL